MSEEIKTVPDGETTEKTQIANIEENGTAKAPDTSESCSLEPSSLEKKIIRQMEYYFGDANLPRDKFLSEEIKKDSGWVSLTTLLTFNRLKALSEDADVIVAALKKSDDDLLEIKGDNSAVRRHPTRPLPTDDEESRKNYQQRLVYAKGFPVDQTLDDLIEFFDNYGAESVQQRKDARKKFKGSVFVLFKTPENAKSFIEAAELKYKDHALTERLYKHDYHAQKQNSRMESKKEAIKNSEEAKKQKEKEEKEELQSKITHGSVLKVSGLTGEPKMDALKEYFGQFGKVAWVDFSPSDEYAYIRYATENEAKIAWEKAKLDTTTGEGDKVKFGDNCELTAVVLEGDEEEAHWKNIFQSIQNKYNSRGGGRGSRGRGRGASSFKRKGERGGHGGKKSKNE